MCSESVGLVHNAQKHHPLYTHISLAARADTKIAPVSAVLVKPGEHLATSAAYGAFTSKASLGLPFLEFLNKSLIRKRGWPQHAA